MFLRITYDLLCFSFLFITLLSVNPMIWIPNQLVGAPVGTTVKLECHTEASPRAIAYWAFQARKKPTFILYL